MHHNTLDVIAWKSQAGGGGSGCRQQMELEVAELGYELAAEAVKRRIPKLLTMVRQGVESSRWQAMPSESLLGQPLPSMLHRRAHGFTSPLRVAPMYNGGRVNPGAFALDSSLG